MNSLGITFFFILITISRILAAENKTESNHKPKVTRTVLHIARSLDPSKTELLNVKSRNGEIATLIVKKREGKTSQNQNHTETNSTARDDRKIYSHPRIQDSPTLLRAAKAAVPEPVNVRSDTILVKDIPVNKKKGRTLSEVDVPSGDIPVIEGIRVPDDENDKFQTWRNARVINGVLVPYKTSPNTRVSVEGTEKKEITLRSSFETQEKPLSMFQESDEIRSQWKGIAESMKSQPVKPLPITGQQEPNKIIEYITKINDKESDRRKGGRSIEFEGASRRMDENVDENDEPLFVNTQPKEMWTEHGKIKVAQRRIDEYEDDDKKRISASLPVEARGEDDDSIFRGADHPRMLQTPGIVSFPSSSLYASQGSRVSFEGVRTPVLQYAHPELGVQPAKVSAEPETVKIAADKHKNLPPIKYFADDPHADRSPYAFEPGLVEDTLTDNANYNAPDVANNIDNNFDVKNIEFTTSMPVKAIDPEKIDITEAPRRINTLYDKKSYEDTYGLGNDKYIKRYPYTGYSGNYPISKDDYYKWKMSGMGHGTGHKGYYVKIKDERPFWEKIGDSIKETVQSGVESVKDLTRPVVEPIYEATQKISENLGINEATARISNTLGFNQGSGMRTAIQEKIGTPMTTNSGILPALGLVAGGAALGLGALAAEKLLFTHMNLLKRSESGNEEPLPMEHKRALEAIAKAEQNKQNTSEAVPEGRSLPPNQGLKRDDKDDFKRLIDQSGIEGLERFHFNVDENVDHQSRRRSLGSEDTSAHIRQKRVRRAVYDMSKENHFHVDNSLDYGEKYQEQFLSKLAALGHPNAWSNTSCAKRIFCDVMLRQSHDSVLLMEKRMTTFLALTKPPVADSVSQHIQQVISAVKSRDCSSFFCVRHDPR